MSPNFLRFELSDLQVTRAKIQTWMRHKILSLLTLILSAVFVLKMSYAYYIWCIYPNALKKTFTVEANTINPDQTAPYQNYPAYQGLKQLW